MASPATLVDRYAPLPAGAALLAAEHRWECPNCTLTDVTHEQRPHTRMHSCRGLFGMTAPMVPAGTRCKVVAQEREDYVGRGQLVTTDGRGRPITAVVTVRDDGQDCTVFAPCATVSASDIDLPTTIDREQVRR